MIIIAVFFAVAGGLIVVKFQPKFAYIVAAIYFAGIVYFTFIQRMSMSIEGTVKSSAQLWTPFTMSRCLFIQ